MSSNNSKSVITWRQRTKLKGIAYLGGHCQHCGYNRCMGALQFHHKDPKEKEFSISGRSLSWDRIKAELDKCLLLCSNCHAEIHYKEINITLLPENVKSTCSKCSKIITKGAQLCNSCFERPKKIVWPDNVTLQALVKSTSLLQLSKYLGVSDNAIKKHCIKAGIVIKKV